MDGESWMGEPLVEFIRVTNEPAVYQTLVNIAADHLPADLCKVATVDGTELVPQARSDERSVDPDRRLAVGGNVIGHTVISGTPNIIDDIQFTRSAAAAVDTPPRPQDQLPPRALMVVPIEDHGVLVGTASQPGVFTADDRETAERLVSYAVAALDRIHRESEPLHDRDRFTEFGSILAHDLRGPLGVAHGYTKIARNTGDLDHLDSVIQAHDRMDQMITDLRELIEAGRIIDTREDVSVARIANQCWDTITTDETSLTIDGDIVVHADRSQLRHLFENLFRNAVDHGGAGVTVTVGPLADGFYVEDTGPGIPPEHEDDLFEAGVTTSDSGTGYGLAIVKRIVDAHGWAITVTESHEGGARFEITGIQ